MSEVSFADFKKIDLRTAKVLKAEEIPGADRIWKLLIDVGSEQKEIVAGIKAHYSIPQLEGKTIIVVNNLEPSVIRGVASRGMLLAGKHEARLSVLTLDQDLPPGSPVG